MSEDGKCAACSQRGLLLCRECAREEWAPEPQTKPGRKELGCQQGRSAHGCFCDGRCKRTQEEQDAYEAAQKQYGGGFFGSNK